MTNAWTIVENDEQMAALGPTDGREPANYESDTTYLQCPEVLVADRCLLEAGHTDNHAADRRDKR
jgi:hypothetical protein